VGGLAELVVAQVEQREGAVANFELRSVGFGTTGTAGQGVDGSSEVAVRPGFAVLRTELSVAIVQMAVDTGFVMGTGKTHSLAG